MSCSQCVGLEQETRKWAEDDIKAYRRGKQSPSTTLLIQALLRLGVGERTLLDIGGGIGEIQLELLEGGALSATSVDISTAYTNAAREEAARKGLGDRVTYRRGDFIDLSEEVPLADIVTLNKVVCCYPDYQKLVGLSLDHAKKYYALVMPVDWWIIKQAIRLMNWGLKLQKSLYVAYIHPVKDVDHLIRTGGFMPVYQRSSLGWLVRVYERG